jgi:hypothetical protein
MSAPEQYPFPALVTTNDAHSQIAVGGVEGVSHFAAHTHRPGVQPLGTVQRDVATPSVENLLVGHASPLGHGISQGAGLVQ